MARVTPPPSAIKSVLAVIIDYQSHEDAEFLSLQLADLASDGFRLQVLHVDNSSPVPHVPSARQKSSGVQVLRLTANHGYAGGINEAIIHSDPKGQRHQAYWFLNADLRVTPDCLNQLVRVLDSQPAVGAVGPRIYKGEGPLPASENIGRATRRATRADIPASRDPVLWGSRGVINPWLGVTAMRDWPQGGPLPRWSYLPGCSILTRSSVYHELGGLPARYRLYFEETEYCVRLQKRDHLLWVEPKAIAYHRVDSLKQGVPARHFSFYFVRNNLYFWQNNFGIPWILQLPRTTFVVAKEVLLPLRRASSPAEAWDRLRYAWYGFVDGFEFLKERFTYHEKRLFLKEASPQDSYSLPQTPSLPPKGSA